MASPLGIALFFSFFLKSIRSEAEYPYAYRWQLAPGSGTLRLRTSPFLQELFWYRLNDHRSTYFHDFQAGPVGLDQLAEALQVEPMVPGGRSADDVGVGVVEVDAVEVHPVGLAEMGHSNPADRVAGESYLLQFGRVCACEIFACDVVEQVVLDVDVGQVEPFGLREMPHALLAYPVSR